MKRRDFLQTSVILGSALFINPSFLVASELKNFGIKNGTRRFMIENSYELPLGSEKAQLWIPLPLNSNYQKLIDMKYNGNFKEAKIVNNAYDAKVLYVSWDKNQSKKVVKVTFDVKTVQYSLDLSKATDNQNYSKDVALYLEPTAHIPVDDTVKAFVDDIIKDASTPIEKARKIYDWTVATMYRDNSVIGCGLGDAKRALEKKLFGGKCTDISSVFVALLRNAHIPAREVFGIRAGKSKISKACGKADKKGFANITGGQHCRAEFYISGLGWVPADPADVAKVKLAEKLTKKDKKMQQLKEFMFGSWEMNWVAFNYARDFVLSPKPSQYPLNMLGYPYAELGEDPLNYYDPKSFKYKYLSQELL